MNSRKSFLWDMNFRLSHSFFFWGGGLNLEQFDFLGYLIFDLRRASLSKKCLCGPPEIVKCGFWDSMSSGHDKMSFPRNDVSQNQDRTKPSFPIMKIS